MTLSLSPKRTQRKGYRECCCATATRLEFSTATRIQSDGLQRFSVSHELGHYFLDGHIDHVLPKDGVHASHAGFVSADPYELEADQFAASLLMPEELFRKALSKYEPGLTTIESLASLCRTSLPATAIRYAGLTEDAIAVVVSTGANIDYCCLSDTMKSLREITWLKQGTPVPRHTITAQLNSNAGRITEADREDSEINIMDWLGGIQSVQATEEVVGLGRYGKTLTVLSCPSIVDETYRDDNDEDEENLVERWTPRFRR